MKPSKYLNIPLMPAFEFAEALRDYMEANKLTLDKFAKLCGVQEATLKKWLNGQQPSRPFQLFVRAFIFQELGTCLNFLPTETARYYVLLDDKDFQAANRAAMLENLTLSEWTAKVVRKELSHDHKRTSTSKR